MRKFLFIPSLFLTIFLHAQTNFSLGFNGTDNYIQVNDNNAIDLSASFSLEAWIYPTGAGSDATQGGIIINKENSYEIARFADGSIQFAMSASGLGSDWAWTNTGLTTPLNQWSHVALIKNGTAIAVYLNGSGSYTDNAQPASLTGNSQDLRIGSRDPARNQFFNGYIDEVRLWNIARTQAEIKASMFNQNLSNSASGLVAYYRMNEGSGITTVNSCTNTTGIDATLVNAPTWQDSPVQFAANAISFDGTNDVVIVPDNNTLHITTAITLEAWCYATKNSGIQDVINKSSNSTNTGYIFPRTDDGWSHVVLYLYIGGWRTLSAAYPSLNTWHHLAATYDGATMKLYIDGVLAASQAQTGAIATNTNPLTLGNQTGFPEYFGGTADEFRLWNVARTQAEIQDNMSKELDPTTQTGLVSYYPSNQAITGGNNTGLITLVDQEGNNNGTLTNFALSGSSSNFVAQNSNLFVLPLHWLSFTAQKQNEHVLLTWSTAAEQSTKDFIVQHSMNGRDWDAIETILAGGNSRATNTYSYLHLTPGQGINYYRILQQDIDGQYSYSDTRSLKFTQENLSFDILTNPVIDGMLRVQVNTNTILSLYNYNGALLWKKQVYTGIEMINMRGYSKGIYLIKSGDRTEKIVLQ